MTAGAAGRRLLSLGGDFVGMSVYPTASSFSHQGNKNPHPSADFGDASSFPLFSQIPRMPGLYSHTRINSC